MRRRRGFIRHRMGLVKIRTGVKNRIHALLEKHGLRCPCSTLFSKKGVKWLQSLDLGFMDDAVLKSDLTLLEALDEQIGFMEAKIAAVAVNDERVKLLMTMPGLSYFAASLLVAEICDMHACMQTRQRVREMLGKEFRCGWCRCASASKTTKHFRR